MTRSPDRDTALELQRSVIEAAFRRGWVRTRVLTRGAYAQARGILDHGGWTGLDQATIVAVRDGARPGDLIAPQLPPAPYIDNITDAEVVIVGRGSERRIAVLFCYDAFPDVRFGYRFEWEPEDPDGCERILLKETIETGALDEMMQDPPVPDEAGIIWADFELA